MPIFIRDYSNIPPHFLAPNFMAGFRRFLWCLHETYSHHPLPDAILMKWTNQARAQSFHGSENSEGYNFGVDLINHWLTTEDGKMWNAEQAKKAPLLSDVEKLHQKLDLVEIQLQKIHELTKELSYSHEVRRSFDKMAAVQRGVRMALRQLAVINQRDLTDKEHETYSSASTQIERSVHAHFANMEEFKRLLDRHGYPKEAYA